MSFCRLSGQGFRVFSQIVSILCLSILLASCSFSGRKAGSVILIAVEGLSFESFSCDASLAEEKKQAGFQTFCEEAVRFTHAYTTSPMSAAAIGSVLTGLYPSEHGLRDNGATYLPGKLKTLAELAREKGVRTAFFSGGAPILYKSGLGQGFESFRDAVRFHLGKYHQSAAKLTADTFDWIASEPKSKHFAVTYLSDLQFPKITTVNNEGEIRSQTSASQLAEIDESIGNFVNQMKSNGYWDASTVILFGLNGGLIQRDMREERGVSLYSENVQIKLFVKPPRKKRDKGLQWKVDQPVSLADLGHTLFEILDVPKARASKYSTTSLMPVLNSLDVDLPEARKIPIESAWAQWRKVGIPRLSVRMDQYLYIFDKKSKFYNTIYDRQERAQIGLKDPLAMDSLDEIQAFAKSTSFKRWRRMAPTLREKLVSSRKLFSQPRDIEVLKRDFRHLSIHRSWDNQIWGLRARLALETQDWGDLLNAGKAQDHSGWQFVALTRLGKDDKSTTSIKLEGCDRYLATPEEKMVPQECSDETFQAFIGWAKESDPFKAEQRKEVFLRKYRWHLAEKQAYELNYLNGLTWSTDIMAFSEPTPIDLALALPRFQALKRQIDTRLN